jgi:hypothetical protein
MPSEQELGDPLRGRATAASAVEPETSPVSSKAGVPIAWKPVATAPELSRVWVAGIERATRTCQAYWWWHEDCVSEGLAIEHPGATHWAPIVLPAEFPHPAEQVSA